MMDYSLLDLASLVVYIFGALTFSILTVFYWGERRRTRRSVFPAFRLWRRDNRSLRSRLSMRPVSEP
jgi:hypothetical protein